MDKCRESFEKQKHLTIYISNLVFDEKDNRYIPNEKRIRTFEEWEWKAFSNQAYAVNLAWWAWQSRQAEVDALKNQLIKAGFTDRGGQLLVPPQGKPPCFDLLDAKQAKIDQLKHEKSLQELEINQVAQANQEWQRLVEEKDKRIEELEKACISYKNQRDDNAQKLMVKSVHYLSIQEELAKLKDRLELAHHLATQSTWSSLKQLRKVAKALRGEHE